jgi:hypothetical protein
MPGARQFADEPKSGEGTAASEKDFHEFAFSNATAEAQRR